MTSIRCSLQWHASDDAWVVPVDVDTLIEKASDLLVISLLSRDLEENFWS